MVTNTLGHIIGILIFGMFIALSFRKRHASSLRTIRLALSAAALALLWNLASLAALFMNGTPTLYRIIASIGFCILSFLPAVMVDIYLANRSVMLVRCGYWLSVAATTAHFIEQFQASIFYGQAGLAVVIVGFGILTAISAVKAFRSESGSLRLLGLCALASLSLLLFSISFGPSCAGQGHQAWSIELAIHHAGIPLALFLLLSDYRFVLLYAFIRILGDGLLTGLFALGIALSSSRLEFTFQVLVTGLVLAVFPAVRGVVNRLLTRILYQRLDPQAVMRELRTLRVRAVDEGSYLREASERIALFMKADIVEIPQINKLLSIDLLLPALSMQLPQSRDLQRNGVEVVVPIRLGYGDCRHLLLGGRRGGRGYLRGDIETLAQLAACIAEEVDKIREIEMRRLVSQAELRALQSQIHPHFLFNAFNTLYGIIPRAASEARQMVLNLSDIFRYFLQSEKTYIALEEELHIVQAYLSIEELRLGGRLRIIIEVEECARRELIPMLSVQPLVENAVKHGIAVRPEGGTIRLEVRRAAGGLSVLVSDTGAGFSAHRSVKSKEHAGIGLENLSRRLRICYGPVARLNVESSLEGTTVSFFVPDQRPAQVPA